MDFKLQIYRDGVEHLLVDIDLNTIFSHVIMGEHLVRSTFTTQNIVDVMEGDYIIKGIEQFTINSVDVPVSKDNGKTFIYSIDFEGYIYDLRDQALTHLGALEFSIYVKPVGLVQLVVDCMNEISSGWAVGVVDDLPEQNLEFYTDGKGYTCKGAMIKGADVWKLEFWLIGKTINFTKQAGVDTTLVFEHGRGNGAYEIERGKLDQEYFNRLIIQGGVKNISSTYRSGFKRLRLDEDYLELPLTGGKKRRVGTAVLDDIYPHRTGTITGVSGAYLELFDTSIDFDLEGQRINGETAVIKFTSGENSGRFFEIDKYDHANKKILIKPFVDSYGNTFPSPTYEIKVGDKYVFLGIAMPLSYVTAAETELRAEGWKILNKAANSTLPYYVFLDQKFLRDNNVVVNIGDRVRIKDTDLVVDRMIRTSGIKYPWVNPHLLDLTISDIVPLHYADKADIEIKKNETKVVANTKINYELARRNTKHLVDLKNYVVDPTGNYYTDKIKPHSIETLYLAVGAKETNFALTGISFTPNLLGNPNAFKISDGQLVHFDIQIDGLGFVWNMTGGVFTDLNPLTTYYTYARVSRTSLVGTWVISDEVIRIEDEVGYFHLQAGVLFKVMDGRRDHYFTKGMTFIIGDQIVSGVLRSLDGLMFFNMTEGKFRLGDDDKGIDWNDTIPDTLLIRGAIVQNAGGVTGTIALFRGQYDPLTVYYNGDMVNYAGSLWRYIYSTPIFNVSPIEGAYWTMEVSKGATGSSGAALVSRGEYDHAKTYTGTSIRIDVVSYGGLYYFSRPDAGNFSGILPTDLAKWSPAGAQFESVATNLFLANLAYIENLGVRFLSTSDSGQRIEISGDENNIKFYDATGFLKILLDDNAAIIGYSMIGGVLTPIFGAGMIIGSLFGNFSSISEKAVQTVDFYARGTAIIDKYLKAQAVGTSIGSGSGNLASVGLTLVNGDCSLHDYPFDGQIQRIKNTTSGNITLSTASGATARKMYDLDNMLVDTMIIEKGDVWEFQYYQTGNIWVQTGHNY